MRMIHVGPGLLAQALQAPPGVTAIIGGGGKTTLMEHLARSLAAQDTVVTTTTTRIFPPGAMPVLRSPTEEMLADALRRNAGHPVCVGAPAACGKLAACGLSMETLSRLAKYVLVEADGAKHLPLKAPAPHEPVIPPETALVIAVAGLDGIGRPIREAAFRPERYAAVLGAAMEHSITPEDVARVLVSTDGQRRGVLPGMRFCIVLNKADDAAHVALAEQVAAKIPSGAAENIFCTSLQRRA